MKFYLVAETKSEIEVLVQLKRLFTFSNGYICETKKIWCVSSSLSFFLYFFHLVKRQEQGGGSGRESTQLHVNLN